MLRRRMGSEQHNRTSTDVVRIGAAASSCRRAPAHLERSQGLDEMVHISQPAAEEDMTATLHGIQHRQR